MSAGLWGASYAPEGTLLLLIRPRAVRSFSAVAGQRVRGLKMTSDGAGDRLFERTMWNCSADDGLVVKGGSAAELYGIATEK